MDNLLAPFVPWLWYLAAIQQGHPSLPVLFGQTLRVALNKPLQDTPKEVWLDRPEAPIASPPVLDRIPFVLKCVSANVLTLYPSSKNGGASTSSRHLVLLSQFRDAGVHAVGVQETRATWSGHRVMEDFHVFSAAAAHGNYGVQLWLAQSFDTPHGTFKLRHEHCRILHSTSRRLIVLVNSPWLKLRFLVGHTPSGGDASTQQFWDTTSGALQVHKSIPLIAMLDANSRVGSSTSAAIGAYAAESENPSGSMFHSWLLREDLAVPQTFPANSCMSGPTFRHSRGLHSRLDYIAVSQDLFHEGTLCKDSDVDLTLVREDHSGVELHLPIQLALVRQRSPPLKPTSSPEDLWNRLSTTPWTCNVHDHAVRLHSWAESHVPVKPAKKLRKRHLSETTWQLIQEKRHHWLRKRFASQASRRALLYGFFTIWRYTGRSLRVLDLLDDPSVVLDCSWVDFFPWKRLADRTAAVHELAYRKLCNPVVQAVRWEDAAYYQALGQKYGDEALPTLWKSIRRVLPKTRKKCQQNVRCRAPPVSALAAHFESLEAGYPAHQHDLLHQCHEAQLEQMDEAPLAMDLCSIPTRCQVEAQIRKMKTGKAAGLDKVGPEILKKLAHTHSAQFHMLFAKCWMLCAEPIMWKGGLLHALPKQANSFEASSTRGVMLLTTIGKTFHGLVRGELIKWADSHRLPTQLGGFKHLQTSFASLLLNSYCNLGLRARMSIGVIFLDLKSAFHFLLRSHTFGGSGVFPEPLVAALEADGFTVEQIQALCDEHASLFVDSASPAVTRLAQETHKHTWFALRDDPDLHGTCRGSRPGSPLADVAFNTLMVTILSRVQQFLAEQPEIQRAEEALGHPCPLITWVDDVCLPVTTCDAGALDDLVSRVMSFLRSLFKEFGMLLNMKHGKTEVVMFYRGQGAATLRQHRFLDQGGQLPFDGDGCVRVVEGYQHLGARFSQLAALRTDIKRRIAQANAVFKQLQRPIFLNRRIAVETRLSLLESLVLSIVFYNSGAWPLLSASVYSTLQHAVLGWQRQIAGIGFWSVHNLSDSDFLGLHQLPNLAVRLALHRLRLAFQLFQYGPELLHCTLADEFAVVKDSWGSALSHSLSWWRQLLSSDTLLTLDFPTDGASWNHLVTWFQTHFPRGPSLLKRTLKRHLMQESIATRVRLATLKISHALQASGLAPAVDDVPLPESVVSFPCKLCDKAFATPQGLQTHCLRVHKAVSYERRLSFGVVCQACHQCYWTSQRLQQHLRYTRLHGAGCFWQLAESFPPDVDPHTGTLPAHLKGVERIPVVSSLGPHPPLPAPRFFPPAWFDLEWRAQWTNEDLPPFLLKSDYQWIANALSTCSCQPDFGTVSDPVSAWLESLHDDANPLSVHDPGLLWAFAIWGRQFLVGSWPSPWPAVWTPHFRAAFLDFFDGLPIWTLLLAADAIPGSLPEWSPAEPADPLVAPVDRRARPVEDFALRFPCISDHVFPFESIHGSLSVDSMPVPVMWNGHGKPALIIIHCFSGRRRLGDIHDWLVKAGEDIFPEFVIFPLSVDTAVCHLSGDLLSSFVMKAIEELCGLSAVALSLTGPPCETWSAARFLDLPPDPQHRRAPRPLWLLPGDWLTCVSVSCTKWICRIGSCGMASTTHEHRELFDRIHGAVHHQVEQWKYGATCCKPTTLRAAGLPHLGHLLCNWEDPLAAAPSVTLGGRNQDGSFRTAIAKEYPPKFSRAIAAGALKALRIRMEQHGCRVVNVDQLSAQSKTWFQSIVEAGAQCTRTTFLPDYQPNVAGKG
eukprot:Skav219466  [mRNA]  locus=scaffold596:35905:41300:- [translate_table: standard]